MGEKGYAELRNRGLLPAVASFEQVTAENIHCIEHDLLLNWFRIHLREIGNILPHLSADFLSAKSAFRPVGEHGGSLLQLRIPHDETEANEICFIPDGAFRITDSEHGKSVLFFLEVDMGTEALASSDRDEKDVRQKIVN